MPSIWFAFCSSDAGGAIITHSDATSNDIRILMWVIGALVITLIGIFIAFCCVMYLKHAPEDDEPKKKKTPLNLMMKQNRIITLKNKISIPCPKKSKN